MEYPYYFPGLPMFRNLVGGCVTLLTALLFVPSLQGGDLSLAMPELPAIQSSSSHPIDQFVAAHMAKHGLQAPQTLDDAAWLRRVSLDLVGLLPTVAEQDAFLQSHDPHKHEKLVKELLGRDHQYTEHWISFWNDLLRNDYAGTGYIDGGRKQISSWLYDSLQSNKPYDQFVRELVAPSAEAEGFIRGIKWRGRVNASQIQELQFARSVSQVFLGINLKCASCHDSFVDEWNLEDAYGLAAVVAEKPLEMYRCDTATGHVARAKMLFPELGEIDPEAPRDERLRQLANALTSKANGRLARTVVNRLWHRLMGQGIVEPLDRMDVDPFDQKLLDFLAADFVENGYNLKHTLELIATSQTYRAQAVTPPESIEEGESSVFAGPVAKRMTAEQFVDAVWRITDTAPEKPRLEAGQRPDEPVRASLVTADLLQRSLGRPNREQIVSSRPQDLTMLVALDLTNGPEFSHLLDRGGEKLMQAHQGESAEVLAVRLWREALCRRPNNDEQNWQQKSSAVNRQAHR